MNNDKQNTDTGSVTIVGFGPGNPELLTLAAVRALNGADVIFYDALIPAEYLDAYPAEKVFVGKRSGRHSAEQDEINRLIACAAQKGRRVVRLHGGDAMLFGRAGEEIDYLRERNIPVSVVPGITTASALAAQTLTSLTQRGVSQSVALINGHADRPIVPDAETLVYYMGARRVRDIARTLIARGKPADTPVLLASNVSMPGAGVFHTTLGAVVSSQENYPTPLLMLAGNVARQE